MRRVPHYFFSFSMTLLMIVTVITSLIIVNRQPTLSTHSYVTVATVVPTVIPSATNVAFATQQHDVQSDFQKYYADHQGSSTLGPAITGEFPTKYGQEQLFRNGALLLRTGANVTISSLPLTKMLLHDAVALPIGGTSVTYAQLQAASNQVMAPWWWSKGATTTVVGIFYAADAKNSASLGHYIPAAFIAYLRQQNGWRATLGPPLTEAVKGTQVTKDGTQNVVVQGFERGVLIATIALDGSVSATVQAPLGQDFVSIYGAPTLATQKNVAIWNTTVPTRITSTANGTSVITTLYSPFKGTFTGENTWVGSTLWLHVTWQDSGTVTDGWVPADQLSFTAPTTNADKTSDLTALSASLATYAQSQGSDVTVAVYIPNKHRLYVDNPDATTVMASTVKVPILLTLLHQAEAQGRSLTATETSLAIAMIEQSDNDAAQTLYESVGWDGGVGQYLAAIGISGITMDSAFGYSMTTPVAMTKLLALLLNGSILNQPDRQFALDLMGHIAPEQQFGIGMTAPTGSSFVMKAGWVEAPDNTWTTGSVGMVSVNNTTYIVAVYAQGHTDINDGWTVVNTVCADVAAILSR